MSIYQDARIKDFQKETEKVNSDDYFALDGSEGSRKIKADKFAISDGNFVDLSNYLLKGCSISTGDVGTIVNEKKVSPNTSFNSLIIPCKDGDYFSVKGTGGGNPRLWSFLDSSFRVVKTSPANISLNNFTEICSVCDGYFVFNSYSDYGIKYSPKDLKSVSFLSEIIGDFYNKTLCEIDLISFFVKSHYINLDYNIDDIVNVNDIVESQNYNYIQFSVKKGDIIQLKGSSGIKPRLWCLTDKNYKIYELSSNSYKNSIPISLKAVEDGFFFGNYNSTKTDSYKGEFVFKNTLNRTNDFLKDLILKSFENINVLFGKVDEIDPKINDSISNLNENNFICLDSLIIDGCNISNVNVGETLNPNLRNPNTDFSSLCVPCKAGDRFKVKGNGGSLPKLWAFLDSNYVVKKCSGESVFQSSFIEVDADEDGFFIFNSYKSYEKSVRIVSENFSNVNKLSEYLGNVFDIFFTKSDLVRKANAGSYYNLQVNVGDVLDESIVIKSDDFSSIKVEVRKGDFIQLKGVSGTKPRLWCLTDKNLLIKSVSSPSLVMNKFITLSVDEDGFLFADFASYPAVSTPAEYYLYSSQNKINDLFSKSLSILEKKVNELDKNKENQKSFIFTKFTNFTECRSLDVSGSTTDLDPIVSDSMRIAVLNCKVGDEFYITGTGGNKWRLWSFIDNDGNIISKSASSLTLNNAHLVSDIDGYFVMQTYISTKYPYSLLTNNKEICSENILNSQNISNKLDKKMPGVVSFGKFYNFFDFSSEIETFDFGTSGKPKTILEQVHSKMDELSVLYPDYVTKIDAANLVGIDYPRYANGIESGDDEYWKCPAYKMFLYKLECPLEKMGNTNGRHPKKKVFLVAGHHGDEVAAVINVYLFAKKLCESDDEIYFKLRTCCDFYIIPCVNGYGLHFFNRLNANHVDINRNYPIWCWSEKGQGSISYTGPSAGSEFETKVVMAIKKKFNADICIDHHNYSNYVVEVEDSPQQLYCTTSTMEESNIVYNAFTECSYSFIKNMPEYFGMKWNIFNSGSAPENIAPYYNGTCNRWFFEDGCACAMTIEICDNINYRNGEPHIGDELIFSPDVWAVGEYTLRNIVSKMVEFSFSKD